MTPLRGTIHNSDGTPDVNRHKPAWKSFRRVELEKQQARTVEASRGLWMFTADGELVRAGGAR
ncbi:MAG: hypothetical protein AAFQ17_07505 [Pseudomonadota bacterium]